LTLQIQVSLNLATSVRALQFNRNVGTKPTSQPNQVPTPIGCLVFKELENQGLALSFRFRVSGEAAHYTDPIYCVNSFSKNFKKATGPYKNNNNLLILLNLLRCQSNERGALYRPFQARQQPAKK